jgi:hypothetical protein
MQAYSFLSAETLITTAKAEAIGSTTSSLTALQDERLLARASQINADFVNSAHTRHPLGGWSWMLAKPYPFLTKAATTLNGALAAGADTVTLTSASDFDSAGKFVIERASGMLEFVDNESKLVNVLTVSTSTGADTVQIAHLTGEKVEKLYALPSDYSKFAWLYVNSVVYPYQKLDQFPPGGYFTIYDSFILMPKQIGAQDCTLYYFRKADVINAMANATNIPTEFSRFAIEKLKAHIYLVRRKRSDIQTALNLAEEELQKAFTMDSQTQSNSEYTRIPLPY